MAVLYDRYSSIVYSVALRVLTDTVAAEDVLEDVFMQLWGNPGSFDSSRGSLGAWLAVISRNRAIDALRKRCPASDIEDVVVSITPDLAADADARAWRGKCASCWGPCRRAQRAALELAYFEGLTHNEIAAKTGEPLGTIKTRISRGADCAAQGFFKSERARAIRGGSDAVRPGSTGGRGAGKPREASGELFGLPAGNWSRCAGIWR